EPHEVTHVDVEPAQQANPLSHTLSQSSSRPLQVSAGATQAPSVQAAEHARVPVEPQVVVQADVVPAQHANTLSQPMTQSSSRPLQISAGGVQAPHAQAALHVWV